jgi:Holliday junction resolvasome RuvABC endonuclease subunit
LRSCLISIDTSINNAGVSVFDLETYELVEYGLVPVKHKRGQPLEAKLENLFLAACEIFNKYSVDWDVKLAVIERAEKFTYNRNARGGKSITQAAMNINHNAVGLFATYFAMRKIPFRFVTPEAWKGKMRKEGTIYSVNMEFGLKLTIDDNDTADAIGIGRWVAAGWKFDKRIPGNENMTISEWYSKKYGKR